MYKVSKAPNYNLKVVISETGLKPDTIRAWERRYGMPQPERTSGGHRLYSQYDIETIKWLKKRQQEGLRINHAVKLWREIENSGQDPLQNTPATEVTTLTPQLELVTGSTLENMRENWVAACMDFDEPTADNILAQAFARYSLETVCTRVIQQGLSHIGSLWYSGKSTVQQEHFASALALRRLNALIAAAPLPSRKGRILIGCPQGENHVISPLLINLYLHHQGWDVIYLGANIPLNQLDVTIQSTKPNLIILAAQQLYTAANLYEAAMNLQGRGIIFAYGGLVFNRLPELRKRFPAHFLGETLDQVVFSTEQILANSPPTPKVENVPEAYKQARAQFREKRPLIDAFLWTQFQQNGMKDHHMEIANVSLGQDIDAALTLGDLDLLNSEVDWLENLLALNNFPVELLSKYLALYKQALEVNLDERGRLIFDWFDKVVHF